MNVQACDEVGKTESEASRNDSAVFAVPRSVRPLRVLVVDDDAATCLVLASAVRLFGHVVETARDGEEAWRRWCEAPFDVVLSDRCMPRVDGHELCRRIREAKGAPYTYFIFVTALDDKQGQLAELEAGADDYLTKPVDLDALEARLVAAGRITAHHARLDAALASAFDAARTDELTGLANRRRLDEDLEVFRARAHRYGHRYACAMCDVDLFKGYNDRYGHLAGDAALHAVADAILGAVRRGDSVYRYGGEEFLVVLPEQSLACAAEAMERVRAAVEALAIPHEASPARCVTISVGVAELALEGEERASNGIGRADAALYRAKGAGRNRVMRSDA